MDRSNGDDEVVVYGTDMFGLTPRGTGRIINTYGQTIGDGPSTNPSWYADTAPVAPGGGAGKGWAHTPDTLPSTPPDAESTVSLPVTPEHPERQRAPRQRPDLGRLAARFSTAVNTARSSFASATERLTDSSPAPSAPIGLFRQPDTTPQPTPLSPEPAITSFPEPSAEPSIHRFTTDEITPLDSPDLAPSPGHSSDIARISPSVLAEHLVEVVRDGIQIDPKFVAEVRVIDRQGNPTGSVQLVRVSEINPYRIGMPGGYAVSPDIIPVIEGMHLANARERSGVDQVPLGEEHFVGPTTEIAAEQALTSLPTALQSHPLAEAVQMMAASDAPHVLQERWDRPGLTTALARLISSGIPGEGLARFVNNRHARLALQAANATVDQLLPSGDPLAASLSVAEGLGVPVAGIIEQTDGTPRVHVDYQLALAAIGDSDHVLAATTDTYSRADGVVRSRVVVTGEPPAVSVLRPAATVNETAITLAALEAQPLGTVDAARYLAQRLGQIGNRTLGTA